MPKTTKKQSPNKAFLPDIGIEGREIMNARNLIPSILLTLPVLPALWLIISPPSYSQPFSFISQLSLIAILAFIVTSWVFILQKQNVSVGYRSVQYIIAGVATLYWLALGVGIFLDAIGQDCGWYVDSCFDSVALPAAVIILHPFVLIIAGLLSLIAVGSEYWRRRGSS